MNQIKDPLLYVDNIEDSINQIEDYLIGLDYDQYKTDIKTQDAVCMRLQIIGESVSKLPVDLRDRFPDVEWNKN